MPARPLLERLGARINYEARSKTLVAELNIAGGTRRIRLSPGSGTAGSSGTAGGHGTAPGSKTPARSDSGKAYAEIDGHQFSLQMPVRSG
jgi:hypothetical protein